MTLRARVGEIGLDSLSRGDDRLGQNRNDPPKGVALIDAITDSHYKRDRENVKCDCPCPHAGSASVALLEDPFRVRVTTVEAAGCSWPGRVSRVAYGV